MHRIDGAGNVNGAWVAENALTNQPPTEITAEWMNAVQEESIAVLVAAGIAPSKLDNAQLLQAIRAIIKKNGLSASVFNQVTATATLNDAHIGATTQLALIVAGTITLPLANSVRSGDRIELWSNGAKATISKQGANAIFVNGSTIASFDMGVGDTVVLESDGVSNWIMTGGSVQLVYSSVFDSSKGLSGWQKLPSGLIIQWGKGSLPINTDVTVTYPVAFPAAILNVFTTTQYTNGSGVVQGVTVVSSTPTLTNFIARNNTATTAINWLAIGF